MAAAVHLISGSTGAGKTTYATRLAEAIGGLRFSIDDWMAALFWPDSPQPLDYAWTLERIGRCEAVIWDMAKQALALGRPVVLDLGFTRAEHRRRFAELASAAGIPVELHVLDIPAGERWRRVQARDQTGEMRRLPFNITRELFDFVEELWEPPDAAELSALNGRRVYRVTA